MLCHHASMLQSSTCILHRRISLFLSFSLCRLEWPNISQPDPHTRPASVQFPLPLPYLWHAPYGLLANGTPKSAKMDASFFPSGRHSPIGYTILANHGRNGYVSNSIHRTTLQTSDGQQSVLPTHYRRHGSPKPLPVRILPHDPLLFARGFPG